MIAGRVDAMAKQYFKEKYSPRPQTLYKCLTWLSSHIRNIRKRAYPQPGEEEEGMNDVDLLINEILA